MELVILVIDCQAWCSVVKWFTAFCAADAFGELMMPLPRYIICGENLCSSLQCRGLESSQHQLVPNLVVSAQLIFGMRRCQLETKVKRGLNMLPLTALNLAQVEGLEMFGVQYISRSTCLPSS